MYLGGSDRTEQLAHWYRSVIELLGLCAGMAPKAAKIIVAPDPGSRSEVYSLSVPAVRACEVHVDAAAIPEGIDRHMTRLHGAPWPGQKQPSYAGGIVNALCERMQLEAVIPIRGELVPHQARYSRGGVLEPFAPCNWLSFERGTRLVALPDPMLFAEDIDMARAIEQVRALCPAVHFTLATEGDPF